MPAYGSDRLDAVHFGHEEVGEHHIHDVPVEIAERLAAVFRRQDLVAPRSERETQVIPQVGVVFDHEDSHYAYPLQPPFRRSCRWITTEGQYDTTVK